jgi:hypothetical protein
MFYMASLVEQVIEVDIGDAISQSWGLLDNLKVRNQPRHPVRSPTF